MTLRSLIAAAVVSVSALLSTPSLAEDLPITAEEFGLWRDYQSALTDPRVQKLPEKQRLPAIARNFRVSERKLQAAIEKGDLYGEKVGKQSEESIRQALADTEFAPFLKEIRVDASVGHIVAYLTFGTDRAEAVNAQACLAVSRAQKAAPLASTFKLQITDLLDPNRKLFEGLIGRAGAEKIKEDSIVDFASTRYIKLFEKVKRAQP